MQLKIRGLGAKNLEGNYGVLKSKSRCILLNKNKNFDKNETESKIKNPTHCFRDMNLAVQLKKESNMKNKTVMSWSFQKKKYGIFCAVYFAEGNFFNIRFLSQCILYWVQFQNKHTFTYQKISLHTFFCLFLKSSKAFNVSLMYR